MADNFKVLPGDNSIVKWNDLNNNGKIDNGEKPVATINLFKGKTVNGKTTFKTFTITGTASSFTKDDFKTYLTNYAADTDDTSGNGFETDAVKDVPKLTAGVTYNFNKLKNYADVGISTTTTPTPNPNFNTAMNGVTNQINSAVNTYKSDNITAYAVQSGDFDGMINCNNLSLNNALNRIWQAVMTGFNCLTNGAALNYKTTTTNGDDPAAIDGSDDKGDENDTDTTQSVKLTEKDNGKTKGSKVIQIDVDLRYEYANKEDEEKEGAYYKEKSQINELIGEYRNPKTSSFRKQRIVAQIARLKKYLDEKDPNRKLSKTEREDKINVTLSKFEVDAQGKCSDEGIQGTICGMTMSELKEKINRTIDNYKNAKTKNGKFQLACTIAQLKSLYTQLKAKGKKTGKTAQSDETTQSGANTQSNTNGITPDNNAFFTKFTPEEIAKQPAEIQKLQKEINGYIDSYNITPPSDQITRGTCQYNISRLREKIQDIQNEGKTGKNANAQKIKEKKATLQRLMNNLEIYKTKPQYSIEAINKDIQKAKQELRDLGVPEKEIQAIKGIKPTK